jgi:hypothetical protein
MLVLALVLSLSLLPTVALADDLPPPAADMSFAAPPITNDVPERAVVLNGVVEGDIAAVPPTLGLGKYAYVSFYYPGDNRTVTIGVDFLPGDPGAMKSAGFKVYGPTGGKLYATGAQTGKHPSFEATFTSGEAGTYLLQISNANLKPIHYVASATGLPPQPTPTATPEPAPPAPVLEPVQPGDTTSPDSPAPRILIPA